MSSGSESDTSERSSTSVEDVLDKSSDEEDEEDRDDCTDESDSLPVFFVARGVEFHPEGAGTVVEEDRPEGIQLDEFSLANAVAYIKELVQTGELVITKTEETFIIEITKTGALLETPAPEGQRMDSVTDIGLFREFVLQDGAGFLLRHGLVIWSHCVVPGKASQKRVFRVSDLSLEAMRARS